MIGCRLEHLRIGRRLGLAFAATIIPMVGAVFGGVALLPTAERKLDQIVQVDQRKSALAAVIGNEVRSLNLALGAVIMSDDADAQAEFRAKVEGGRKRCETLISELDALEKTEEGRKLVDSVKEVVGATQETTEQALRLALGGQAVKAAAVFTKKIVPFSDALEEVLNELGKYEDAQTESHLTLLSQLVARSRVGLSLFGTLAIVVMILLVRIITRSITVPLARAIRHFDTVISQGDFTLRLSEADIGRKDEVGDVVRSIEKYNETMRSVLRRIAGSVQTLAGASTELSSLSNKSSADVERAAAMVGETVRGIGKAASEARSVAEGMQVASARLGNVAVATEEMTATMSGIATDAEKAKSTTERAVDEVGRVATVVQELSVSANKIGKVTETITNVAAQTKLLALNATVEAARAGVAGRGFAVVANEIRALAQETASASGDIRERVSAIQTSTRGVLADVAGISHVIVEVSGTVTGIAKAIEQHSATTTEIARDIASAAQAVKDGNDQASRSSVDLGSAATSAGEVTGATQGVSSASARVQKSATTLARLSEELRSMLASYKV